LMLAVHGEWTVVEALDRASKSALGVEVGGRLASCEASTRTSVWLLSAMISRRSVCVCVCVCVCHKQQAAMSSGMCTWQLAGNGGVACRELEPSAHPESQLWWVKVRRQ
jgi:hypothetical protein